MRTRSAIFACALAALALLGIAAGAPSASAHASKPPPATTRIVHTPGQIVPAT